MPYNKDAKSISRWNRFDQRYLPCLLDFDRVHVWRWITVLVGLPVPFALAPSRPHDPPLFVPGLPLPARLQAPGKLEAWEYVSFGIDDYGV